MSKIQLLDQPNECMHCHKKFRSSRTLISHMCEKKRRSFQETEKRVQAGYMAFNRFWYLSGHTKPKTYKEFSDTAYYNAFVKFGSFINNVNPLYPDKFIDFVIKSGVKLDQWCRDELYEKYLYDMIKIEPVENAVQRSIKTMMEWADSHNDEFTHYLDFVSYNQAVHDILNGKMSPWIILNSVSGKTMISKMSDDQLNMIAPAFDIQFWMKKFRELPADVALVKEICKETGIK